MHLIFGRVLSLLLLTFAVSSKEPICSQYCENSCCEISSGNFQCCPFINGICCGDGNSCCPQGSRCDPIGWTCSFPNGIILSRNHLTNKDTRITPIKLHNKFVETPTVCPDRKTACPINSTCCSMSDGLWGCCDSLNAVCCSDGAHCCPHGTKCNEDEQRCDPVEQLPSENEVDNFFSLVFASQLGRPRTSPERVTSKDKSSRPIWNAMTYAGVRCDEKNECPTGTTCCRDQSDAFACCPFSQAVCCADKMHCCPENYSCDERAGRCLSNSVAQTIQSAVERVPLETSLKDEQLCPDGSSRCPYVQTCCQLVDKSWGCCPLSEAVCCSDGLHCCPSGYSCNIDQKTCVKRAIAIPPSPPSPATPEKISCPNAEFQCAANTTCCSLPNDEWACCPLSKAVCCSDQAHCCPENTTCDLEHNRCMSRASGTSVPFAADSFMVPLGSRKTQTDSMLRDTCQPPCPFGTCCKHHTGTDYCCPMPNAVCCSDGLHCCPNGMTCDGNSGMCLPSQTANQLPESLPWMEKLPAQQSPATSEPAVPQRHDVAAPAQNITCPDRNYVCKPHQTCCPSNTGGYGCCPFANGTCCSDKRHCCPANTVCGPIGQCIRQLDVKLKQTVSQAHKMTPTSMKSSLPFTQAIVNRKLGQPINAEWCGGLCPNGGFCCADDSGTPRRKCCPATAGVCCSDGEHCCPRGTRCIGNGLCQSESQNVQTSFAPYLVPAMDNKGASPDFLNGLEPQSFYHMMLAKEATVARINPLFLLDFYYEMNARKFAVCPDLVRTCTSDQQCCSSLKYRYVCAPKGTTCCPYTADTYCPSGMVCSKDGLLCEAA